MNEVTVVEQPIETPAQKSASRVQRALDSLAGFDGENTQLRQSWQECAERPIEEDSAIGLLEDFEPAVRARLAQIEDTARSVKRGKGDQVIASFNSQQGSINSYVTHMAMLRFLEKRGLVEFYWQNDEHNAYGDDDSWRIFIRYGPDLYTVKYLPGKDGGWEYKITLT